MFCLVRASNLSIGLLLAALMLLTAKSCNMLRCISMRCLLTIWTLAQCFSARDRQPSVIQLRSRDVNPYATGALVIAELNRTREEIMAGAVVTLDLKRTRLRILPFRRGALQDL